MSAGYAACFVGALLVTTAAYRLVMNIWPDETRGVADLRDEIMFEFEVISGLVLFHLAAVMP